MCRPPTNAPFGTERRATTGSPRCGKSKVWSRLETAPTGRGRTGADGQTRHAGRRRRIPQRHRSHLRPGTHRRAISRLRCLARRARRGGRRARPGCTNAGRLGGRYGADAGSGVRQLQPGASRSQRRLAHNYEEPPFIAADEARPLAPGMVVSVELPYYLLGVGSFQMERMVQIGASGAEVLDRLPFELDPRRGSEDAKDAGRHWQGAEGSSRPSCHPEELEGSRLNRAYVREEKTRFFACGLRRALLRKAL